MQIRFITGNPGKLREAKAKLSPLGIEVVSHRHEYPELQVDELEEVARFGLQWLYANDETLRTSATPFMLEDAGLFVDALGGFPGVYSAYVFKTIGYEGILQLMKGHPASGRRGASFQACIGYYDPRRPAGERTQFFTGKCPGTISSEPRGSGGFGFDPIFVPEGRAATFAQLAPEEKNELSHRAHALEAMVSALSGPTEHA